MKNLKRTPKRIGELAELAFLHRATAEGLIVSHPYGDSAPFDFITLGNGKMCRVQVKCAGRLVRHGQYHFNFRKNVGRNFEPYRRQHIDFIAAYILPLDRWYILPPQFFLRSSSLDISPQPNHRSIATHTAAPYVEAWRLLFDRDAAGFTLHACAALSAEPFRERRTEVCVSTRLQGRCSTAIRLESTRTKSG